jgi:hypothetical protein
MTDRDRPAHIPTDGIDLVPHDPTDDPYARLRRRYRRFATHEASGASPIYEAFALAVADDEGALAFLSTLPADKQQPNLLFAAVRHVAGTPSDAPALLDTLADQAERIRSVMSTRRVQTNEPARCATLLPALAMVPPPLALIEVGASAGLCLLPDRYHYRFGDVELRSPRAGADAPVFPC